MIKDFFLVRFPFIQNKLTLGENKPIITMSKQSRGIVLNIPLNLYFTNQVYYDHQKILNVFSAVASILFLVE